MNAKQMAVCAILVGILIGLWEWQVDNLNNALAQNQARVQAQQTGSNSFSWSYQPAPVADRAMGMAFAFLICSLGCFTYVMASKAEERNADVDELNGD